MFVDVTGERLEQVRFDGAGCTVSQVAADVVAELAQGRSVADARGLALEAVLGVLGRELVQTRFDCAGLALRTLHRALASA
jgi:nitrogen fixation NifU-like protein